MNAKRDIFIIKLAVTQPVKMQAENGIMDEINAFLTQMRYVRVESEIGLGETSSRKI